MITIDDVKLPMHNIKNLQTPNYRFQLWDNTYYVEPSSTDAATKCVVKILDAKYEKADLPKIVEEQCSHITCTKCTELLKLLTEFE